VDSVYDLNIKRPSRDIVTTINICYELVYSEYRMYKSSYYLSLGSIAILFKEVKNIFNLGLSCFCNERYKQKSKFHDDIMIPSLANIEANGIFNSDKDKFDYTSYNIHTTTGRPSNKWNGINYAGLNKSDGTRDKYISSFHNRGLLIEYDYEAYHLQLIADLTGYKFPDDISPHKYMASQYFNIDIPNDEQIKEAKQMSFQLMYGKDTGHNSSEIEFINKVKGYERMLWDEFNVHEGVRSVVFDTDLFQGVKYCKIERNKLLNYFIQYFETERNMIIISALLKLLKGYKTKLVLYTYDSFLFDYNLDDGKELLDNIGLIINQGNYSYTTKYGINYGSLKKIN